MKMNIFKKIKTEFFATRANNYINKIDFWPLIKIINDYDLCNTKNTQLHIKKIDNVYYIYYDNLFIKITDDKNKIVEIYLKKNNESWNFENGDPTKPINSIYRVYLDYTIYVMDDDVYFNHRYTSGTWNEYVFHIMKVFVTLIQSYTEKFQMQRDYYN